jgi:hypothetical protein
VCSGFALAACAARSRLGLRGSRCALGGCGGPAAAAVAAVAAVEAVEDNLSAKAAVNESVDGRMTAYDDEIGRRTTTQQPTNEAARQREVGGSLAAARWRWQRRWRQGGAQRDGGRVVAAARQLWRWRHRESATSAAAWRR